MPVPAVAARRAFEADAIVDAGGTTTATTAFSLAAFDDELAAAIMEGMVAIVFFTTGAGTATGVISTAGGIFALISVSIKLVTDPFRGFAFRSLLAARALAAAAPVATDESIRSSEISGIACFALTADEGADSTESLEAPAWSDEESSIGVAVAAAAAVLKAIDEAVTRLLEKVEEGEDATITDFTRFISIANSLFLALSLSSASKASLSFISLNSFAFCFSLSLSIRFFSRSSDFSNSRARRCFSFSIFFSSFSFSSSSASTFPFSVFIISLSALILARSILSCSSFSTLPFRINSSLAFLLSRARFSFSFSSALNASLAATSLSISMTRSFAFITSMAVATLRISCLTSALLGSRSRAAPKCFKESSKSF